jgi:23S rRNA (adenine2503-C2)-methyltransferase
LNQSIDILGLTRAEFVPLAVERGTTLSRALGCYRAAFRQGIGLEPWISICRPPMVSRRVEDGVVKFCLRHADGFETESVLVPMVGRGRAPATGRTLCVSSQIGCARGCTFCETAQMGLVRNLGPAEIIAQWFAATHELGERPVNIVFMGMGEPMDNLEAVLQSIRVLCDRDGPAMASSKITVSTVGRIEGIRRYGAFINQDGFRRADLAVSLNAPNDEIRSSIMPINRKETMAALRAAMLEFPKRAKAAICVEYVLIPGVNDADAHCDELCAYLKGIRSALNVIPYNPRRESPWPAQSEADVARFVERAARNGQFVRRRETRGRAVMGACGQLGNRTFRRVSPSSR